MPTKRIVDDLNPSSVFMSVLPWWAFSSAHAQTNRCRSAYPAIVPSRPVPVSI
jgi:hypothetical protein